jgi:HD-GYP domain-containing protein (c-di-GMP phosphodiesterase class II)
MCDGFEQMLQVIRHRLGVLNHAMSIRRSDAARVRQLADRLQALHEGRVAHVDQFMDLAELILDDARQGGRMRFQHADPHTDGVAMAVAAHAINVGQVLARVAHHDFEWANKPALLVFAALVMDVGLLHLPADVLANRRTLRDESLRDYEGHPRQSAELIRTRMPETGPLADVVVAHHERIDGTGFPNGFRNDTIPSAARFLAVADEYARQLHHHDDPRNALTDTLLAAEQGHLDRDFAEYLLHLSFYPLGTIVELNDGRLAVVVATNGNRTNARISMRPVVAILTDSHERALPRPEFVDLATTQVGSIVRAVPRAERNAKLGEWYPDLCCS